MNEKMIAVAGVQSFERIHLKLKSSIQRYLFHLTGTTKDSEDVAQEIFIKLWINWKKVQIMNEDELKSYVFIAIKNFIINQRKKDNRPKRNKRMFLKEYSHFYTGYYWHDDIVVAEGIRIHHEAIEQLPDKEKIAYLYHLNDYSAEEIATIVNRSKFTVDNNISSAYKKVKTYLNNQWGWHLHAGRRNYWKPVSLN